MSSPSFLAGLNEPQLEAVTLPHQSALILAGAGSGKTRVLTTRIAWLIQTGQVSPAGVLAVTFTNKAAREMLTRITAMLPINTRGMWVGTFHGLCNRMLRAHHREAGLPQPFQILDIAGPARADQAPDEGHERRRGTISAARDRSGSSTARRRRACARARCRRLRRVHAPAGRALRGVRRAVPARRRGRFRRAAAALLRACWRETKSCASITAQRFRHILVDEFQDTNRLQYRWLKLLAGTDSAVFAVGDDDQSIYAFRGAHVGNMADFERDFKVEQGDQASSRTTARTATSSTPPTR